MPLDGTATASPVARLHTAMIAIGTALTPIVDSVQYFLKLPEEEKKGNCKVVYIEWGTPVVVINESLESSQRSWMPFNILVYGYYTIGKDSQVIADFAEEIETTLFTSANVTSYRNAFSTDNGFSIERFIVSEAGFGEFFGQLKITLECLFTAP